MNSTVTQLREELKKHLAEKRLLSAIGVLRQMMALAPSANLTAELEKTAEEYDLMVKYALSGTPDPARGRVMTDMTEHLLDLGATQQRRVLSRTAPTLYFNTLRFEGMQTQDTLKDMARQLMTMWEALSMNAVLGNSDPKERDRMENLLVRLFHRIWVSHPLDAERQSVIYNMIDNPVLPQFIRHLLAWAVFLGETEYHDDRRLQLMLRLYRQSSDRKLQLIALTQFILSRRRYKHRRLRKKVEDELQATIEANPRWQKDVHTIAMILVKARDTDRITRKISDELIPDLLKQRDFIQNHMADTQPFDPETMEMNPEWEELLERSGIAGRLREFEELQEQGGDVLMATFGQLKTYPFFREVAHWFMPYHPEHSSLRGAVEAGAGDWLEMLEGAPMMCDGDKFSMALSLSSFPAGQLSAAMGQFREQAHQMAELHRGLADTTEPDVQMIVQTLYRFYRLFRRKGEFGDVFDTPFNPWTIDEIADVVDNNETTRTVAEFYLSRGYSEDAGLLFEQLISRGDSDPVLLQKAGYCHLKSGNTRRALKRLEQAEMMMPEDVWTLRRIADIHAMHGHNGRAIKALERLMLLKPEDKAAMLAMANLLTAENKPEQALPLYYKIDYLGGKISLKALRPMARALLMTDDKEKARGIVGRVLAGEAGGIEAADMVLAGHLELVCGDPGKALEAYRHAMSLDSEQTVRLMEEDKAMLISRGIEADIIAIINDLLTNH